MIGDEMMKMTDAENRLTGALVGLANAIRGNEDKVTQETRRLVREALLLTQGSAAEDALAQMTQKVQSEKWRIVPDCAVCQFPCGRNADYDMELMWTEEAETKVWKVRLLRALHAAAQKGEISDEACFEEFFCEALRTIGDIWDAAMLAEQVLRTENIGARFGVMTQC